MKNWRIRDKLLKELKSKYNPFPITRVFMPTELTKKGHWMEPN